MGCTDPPSKGVGAPHQCPLESVASYLPIYADVRFHIPMTHRNDAGTQAIKPRGLGLEQRLTMTLKKYC